MPLNKAFLFLALPKKLHCNLGFVLHCNNIEGLYCNVLLESEMELKNQEIFKSNFEAQELWLRNQMLKINAIGQNCFQDLDRAVRDYQKLTNEGDIFIRPCDLTHFLRMNLSADGVKKLAGSLRIAKHRKSTSTYQFNITEANRSKLWLLAKQTGKTQAEILNQMIVDLESSSVTV